MALSPAATRAASRFTVSAVALDTTVCEASKNIAPYSAALPGSRAMAFSNRSK